MAQILLGDIVVKKVIVDMENCYGIQSFKHKFDFSGRSVFVVYARNGEMKTSFAKTLKDYSENKKTKDLMFEDRINKRDIFLDGRVKELDKEKVFVIESMNETYESRKIEKLLVSKKLKDEYAKIIRNIEQKQEALIEELANISGLKKKNIEETTLLSAINPQSKDVLESLAIIKDEVKKNEHSDLATIDHQKIFNDKVLNLLHTDSEFKNALQEYIDSYKKLISQSTFFKEGFNHHNAEEIFKSLENHLWFKARHTVNIEKNGETKEIKTKEDLRKNIDDEKEAILGKINIDNLFTKMDKKFKNQELRDFREYLGNNLNLLPELNDTDALKRKIWIAYIAKSHSAFSSLIQDYEKGKSKIKKIMDQAKEEETKWKNVINIFNNRFDVPFKVKIGNQENVILKSADPIINFSFYDQKGEKEIERDDLWPILSSGEKRALYILNILFEIEARKEMKQETLFIVDDIADSFDYKNKYAIIEYLKDIANENDRTKDDKKFCQIILTHNFDFYRTASNSFGLTKEYRLHATKRESDGKLSLVKEKYGDDPLMAWKKALKKTKGEGVSNKILIASIPFVRNLAQYCGKDEHCKILNSLLHIKKDTSKIKVKYLKSIIQQTLNIKMVESSEDEKKANELIYEVSDDIIDQQRITDLEEKIVLSIGIRLKTEEYLIKEINDKIFCESIKNKQTNKLIEKFKKEFPSEEQNIKSLDKVNLMTPENIHLNSFMYEPILDMSNEYLRELYKEIKCLKPIDKGEK